MIRVALTLSLIALTGSAIAPSVYGQNTEAEKCASSFMAQTLGSGDFTKKRYSVHGSWSMSQDCLSQGITFSDDFKTKNGPDLKLFLSPKPLADLNGKNARDGAIKLSVLKSSSGGQSYSIPQDIDLTQYKSVIIQCEAFSVLWGGFDLPSNDASVSDE